MQSGPMASSKDQQLKAITSLRVSRLIILLKYSHVEIYIEIYHAHC